jgi:hypothetical protein
MFYISESMSANLSIGVISSVMLDTIKTFSQIYTAGIQQKLFNNKLTNSYSITSSFGQDNSVYRATVLSRYLFTQSDAVSFSVLYTKFEGKTQTIKSYNEVLASLTFSHSF